MPKPSTLHWSNPSVKTDKTPHTQNDNAGYELLIDGATTVGLPLVWGTTFDLSSQPFYKSAAPGNHTVRIRAVTKDGERSDWSPETTINIPAVPLPPANISVT